MGVPIPIKLKLYLHISCFDLAPEKNELRAQSLNELSPKPIKVLLCWCNLALFMSISLKKSHLQATGRLR